MAERLQEQEESDKIKETNVAKKFVDKENENEKEEEDDFSTVKNKKNKKKKGKEEVNLEDDGPKVTVSLVDKRSTRIAGLPEGNLKKYIAAFKKQFNCGGQIKKEGSSMVMVMQGDHRKDIEEFLLA